MQITLNEEKIDFTLESERNLEEVLAAITKWLAEGGYVLTSASWDGEPLTPGSPALASIAITEEGRLDLSARPRDGNQADQAERLREQTDPKGELRLTGEGLKRSIDELREVPVLLQTGKDREAMAAVIRFTELSTKLVRLFPEMKRATGIELERLEIGGASFPDFYADFNTVLSELVDAFGAGDSVLMGDLLEYEIAPRLEKLKEFIDLILEPS